MSGNANGNKRVIFFSSIAWYYGDNDNFIAHSDVRTWLVVPDTDSRMTCSTNKDYRVTCSKKYSLL